MHFIIDPTGTIRNLNRQLNKTQLASEIGVSRPTLEKLITEFEINRSQVKENQL